MAAAFEQNRETLKLLPTDCGLDVGHAVVVAEFVVRLEDYLGSAVAHRVRHRHAVLTKKTKLRIESGIVSCQHAAVTGSNQLAGMKREAGHVTVRPSDPFPIAFAQDLAADRASGIFYQFQIVSACDAGYVAHVTRHPDLVDAEDRPGAWRDAALDERRVDVEGAGLDVDKHRDSAGVTNFVGWRG